MEEVKFRFFLPSAGEVAIWPPEFTSTAEARHVIAVITDSVIRRTCTLERI